MKWTIEYDNDTGPGDDGFWEWWAVSDGDRAFKCATEDDAKWLCDLLNRNGALVPCTTPGYLAAEAAWPQADDDDDDGDIASSPREPALSGGAA